VAAGVYQPSVRVFDLSQLSLKFERRLDCEAVDFTVLSDDYSKMAFLLVSSMVSAKLALATKRPLHPSGSSTVSLTNTSLCH
jgi:hypothetical protein